MKHEFALYYEALSKQTNEITDSDLVHRISHVLRLKVGQAIVLFNQTHHAEVIIRSITKKKVVVTLRSFSDNKRLTPTITFLMPLLKRDALDDAIYSLVELGVNKIQLVVTERIHRKWGGQKEMDRLRRIAIAAAEQSKNFAFPSIESPIALEAAIPESKHDTSIYFDVGGKDAFECTQQLYQKKPSSVTLLVGPEADLSADEKDLVKKAGFAFCRLTPTILRARQAVAVAVGLIRATINNS